jgi:hypothetical protein
LREHRCKTRLGLGIQDCGKARWIRPDQIPQVRRCLGDRCDEIADFTLLWPGKKLLQRNKI